MYAQHRGRHNVRLNADSANSNLNVRLEYTSTYIYLLFLFIFDLALTYALTNIVYTIVRCVRKNNKFSHRTKPNTTA